MLLPKEKKGGKFRYQKIEKGTEKMRNLLLLLLPETWEEGAAVFSNTLTGMFLWLWCEEDAAEIAGSVWQFEKNNTDMSK